MRISKSIFVIIFSIISYNAIGQVESKDVIQTVINYDQDINERNVIICELLEDFNDTTWTNLLNNKYGGFHVEKFKYFQFGDLNVRLISKSALIELGNVTQKLNDCDTVKSDSFETNYQELVFDLFDRNLCVFNKVLFTENKLYAIVKYRVETGNALGLGEFSVTYLLDKLSSKWKVKEILESEI